MEFANFIIWTKICVFLPLTTLLVFWVCCMIRREPLPVIYYTNLLISNIIQFSTIIFWNFKQELGHSSYPIICIYMVVVMVSLYFRMAIAIERCFVITCPQSNWIRHTGGSMLISFLVWTLCIITVSLSLVFYQIIPLFVLSLLPGPPFIFFSAWTFKALPAATSVPTDEKRRIVGTLVLLFINYFLMILFPTIICVAVALSFFHDFAVVAVYIIFVLFLLSPVADLILFFFMRKGPVDKLLSCLCCCIKDNTAEDVAGHQQLNKLMLQREREREKVNQTV